MKSSNINLANIISFGDSIFEQDASHKFNEILADEYIKTIKFRESQQPMELIKELKINISQFDTIASNMRNSLLKSRRKKMNKILKN